MTKIFLKVTSNKKNMKTYGLSIKWTKDYICCLSKKFEVLIYVILIMSFSIWYISLKKDDNFLFSKNREWTKVLIFLKQNKLLSSLEDVLLFLIFNKDFFS